MIFQLKVFILFATFLYKIRAQTLIQSECIGTIDSAEYCNFVASKGQQCNQIVNDKTAIRECFCTQELFSAYYGCEGELRECSLSYTFDSAISDDLENFHSICDGYVSTPFTTPAVPTLSATADPASCNKAFDACGSFSIQENSCSQTATADSALLNCMCEPQIVSLNSVCLYDGNVSCLLTPAFTTNLYPYTYCNNAVLTSESSARTTQSMISSGSRNQISTTQPSTTSSVATGSSISITSPASSFTATRPFSSTGSTSTIPTPTTSAGYATRFIPLIIIFAVAAFIYSLSLY